MAQPTIARIERGVDDPRVGTVVRLLAACDETLDAVPTRGAGIDLTLVDELLARTPAERIRSLPREVASLERLQRGRRHRRSITP